MPVPHNSVFTGRMLFLLPNQQRESSEGTKKHHINKNKHCVIVFEACSGTIQQIFGHLDLNAFTVAQSPQLNIQRLSIL